MDFKNVCKHDLDYEIEMATIKTPIAIYSMTQLHCFMTGANPIKMTDIENVLNGINDGTLSIEEIELILNNKESWEMFIENLNNIDECTDDELATEKALSEFSKWLEFEPAEAFLSCNGYLAEAGAGLFLIPEYRWTEFEPFIRDYQETGLKTALNHFIHTYCLYNC